MSNFKPTDYKAIAWYAQKENLVPQLSAWPSVTFKKRSNGELITRQIFNLVNDYKKRDKGEES